MDFKQICLGTGNDLATVVKKAGRNPKRVKREVIALSISEYNEEVKQTDLDWIYVSPSHHGKGAGRFLVEQTIERCKAKSEDICVGGTVEFYRKCGFYDYELWVWAVKDGYKFSAPVIQP